MVALRLAFAFALEGWSVVAAFFGVYRFGVAESSVAA